MRGAESTLAVALAFGLAFALPSFSPAWGHARRPVIPAPARLELARAETALRAGHYADVLGLCRARSGRAADDVHQTLLCARAEEATGLYAEARGRLEAAAEARPGDLALRDARMRLYELTGDREAWKPLVDASYADWNNNQVDRTKPAELLAIATAVRLDESWKDANDVLRDAVRADRHAVEANLDWGALLLEKHNALDAEKSFREVLAVDPDNPDGHVGLAEAALDDRYDAPVARREVARALAVNRVHAGALALRARLALDAEDFAAARADVAAIRAVNPRDPGAARVEAAVAFLLDDRDGFARAQKVDLDLHPHDGHFFAFVAEALARQRRYEDARTVAAQGVAADPDDAACLSVLATSELRLGDETAGLETLRRAWQRDPYDVRTYNQLDLFEKVIPARYVTVSSAHLRFRVEPSARAAITEVVAPFLEQRYRADVARYGFEPKGPLTFELYGDPRHFAVRTVGLPAIGVSGVCFGRVITSQSPTNRAFNWGMVLTHELAHVFAIELSRARVPRWFTEGLSEVEAAHARPDWVRHDDEAIYGAMKRGELPSLADLSNTFMTARDGDDATRAYAQAAAAIDFLERRFGFPAIRRALVAYGRGERGAAVLEAVSGLPAAQLDAAFHADLAQRFARYAGQYLPTQVLRGSAAAAAPGARGEVTRGLTMLAAGDLDGARRALDRARAMAHPSADDQADTFFLAGEIALARRDAEAAISAFQAILDLGQGSAQGALTELGSAERSRRGRVGEPSQGSAQGALTELGSAEQSRRGRVGEPSQGSAQGALTELGSAEQSRRGRVGEPSQGSAQGALTELGSAEQSRRGRVGEPSQGSAQGALTELGSAERSRRGRVGEPSQGSAQGALTELGSAERSRRGRVGEPSQGSPIYDGYDLQVRLGLAEIHRKRSAAAEAHLKRALAFDPTRVEPHALLAEMYGDQQRLPEQLGELEAALRLESQNDAVAKDVVLAEARAGRTARVIEFAQVAILIDPGNADLHAALGRALAATGQGAGAAAAFERALAFRPADPASLHLTLAGLYDTLGERARAAAHRAAAHP